MQFTAHAVAIKEGQPGQVNGEPGQLALHRREQAGVVLARRGHRHDPAFFAAVALDSAVREVRENRLDEEHRVRRGREVVPDGVALAEVDAPCVVERCRQRAAGGLFDQRNQAILGVAAPPVLYHAERLGEVHFLAKVGDRELPVSARLRREVFAEGFAGA